MLYQMPQRHVELLLWAAHIVMVVFGIQSWVVLAGCPAAPVPIAPVITETHMAAIYCPAGGAILSNLPTTSDSLAHNA